LRGNPAVIPLAWACTAQGYKFPESHGLPLPTPITQEILFVRFKRFCDPEGIA
jgi:hypothetical protein